MRTIRFGRGKSFALKVRPTAAVTSALWFAADATIAACPVCVGVSDSPLASGMNAGVLVLLGVTAIVLGAILGVGYRVAARAASGGEGRAPGADSRAPIFERGADPC